MKAKYSYFRLEYGRHAGKKKITRYCRVDQLGRVSYAEVRVSLVKNPSSFVGDMYKIGNTASITSPLHQVLPSTKAEYTKMVKQAIKAIL